MAAAINEIAHSTWTLDVNQALAGLRSVQGGLSEVERATLRVSTSSGAMDVTSLLSARSIATVKDEHVKASSAAADHGFKIGGLNKQLLGARSAFSLAGIAASEATGHAAAWVQTGVRIIAQGGIWAAAFTAMGLAVGKIVEELTDATKAAEAFRSASLFFGVSKDAIAAVAKAAADLSKEEQVAIATTLQRAGVTQDQMGNVIGLAKQLGPTVDEGLKQVLAGTDEISATFVQRSQKRIGDLHIEIVALANEIAAMERRGALPGDIAAKTGALERRQQEQEKLRRAQRGVADLQERESARVQTEWQHEENKKRADDAISESKRQAEKRKEDERWVQDTLFAIREEAITKRREQINRFMEFETREAFQRASVLERAEQQHVDVSAQLDQQYLASQLKTDSASLKSSVKSENEKAALRGQIGKAAIDGAFQVAQLFAMAEDQKTKSNYNAIAGQAAMQGAYYAALATLYAATLNTLAIPTAVAAAGMFAFAGIAAAKAGGAPSSSVTGSAGASGGGGSGGGGGGGSGGGGSGWSRDQTTTPTVVNVIFQGRSFVTDAEVGKAIDQALKEHQRSRGI